MAIRLRVNEAYPGWEASFGLRRQATRDAALDQVVGENLEPLLAIEQAPSPRGTAVPALSAQSKEADCASKMSNLDLDLLLICFIRFYCQASSAFCVWWVACL